MIRREPARVAWDAYRAIELLTEAVGLLRKRDVRRALVEHIATAPLVGLTFTIAADELVGLVTAALPEET